MSDSGEKGADVVDLEDVSKSAQLEGYIHGCLSQGGTIKISTDGGPTYLFDQIAPDKLERENMATNSTDIVDFSVLATHLEYGSGEVEIRD